jgi:hypothetical protein
MKTSLLVASETLMEELGTKKDANIEISNF